MQTNSEGLTELELAFQADEKEVEELIRALRLAEFQHFTISPKATKKLRGPKPVETGQLSTRQPRPRKPAPRKRAALLAKKRQARS